MNNQFDFTGILEKINTGLFEEAALELAHIKHIAPNLPVVMVLQAELYRLTHKTNEAIELYKQAGSLGAGARNWLAAGNLLAGQNRIRDALLCLQRGLAEEPHNEEILDALVTTYFNGGLFYEGSEHAQQQIRLTQNPNYLSNAALLLLRNELYEQANEVFRKIIHTSPDHVRFLGPALAAARFSCDWAWIEFLQQRILHVYESGHYAAPQEYPLTHITWCAQENLNRLVTQAYAQKMYPSAKPMVTARHPTQGAIRVGYLSCDFRNHATLHLLISLFENHNHAEFELFAYDYSLNDNSSYRQRFLAAIQHHRDISQLSDTEAAQLIAQDNLDILIELKGHTGGARLGINALRPCAIQVSYLGYPGTLATDYIDYVIADRYTVPNSALPHYSEKVCRLPHSYQCNDRQRLISSRTLSRADYGLPEDGFVFAVFNQSYKIDRGSFVTWLEIVQQTPNSVLWILKQNETAQHQLTQFARDYGLAPERLIFAPFEAPEVHLKRLQLADLILDSLICNGHTSTSDALWAGVPVLTTRGQHFPSRVSESLIRALEMPELVAETPQDMIRLGVALGSDPSRYQSLRRQLRAKRLSAPLFDEVLFTRHFEAGIKHILANEQLSTPQRCLDVTPLSASADPSLPVLSITYPHCPLCSGEGDYVHSANCQQHPLWQPPLPKTLHWLRCHDCGHVYSRDYWSPAGLQQVFSRSLDYQTHQQHLNHDARRALWSGSIERALRCLSPTVPLGQQRLWLDVGCGDGSLMLTASDYGFQVLGLEQRDNAGTQALRQSGYRIITDQGLEQLTTLAQRPHVISLMDVLEHLAYPKQALAQIHGLLDAQGLLIISTPDLGCSSWQLLDQAGLNPYWGELEHHHNFSRTRLLALLDESGFELVEFTIPQRYKAQMELYARKKAGPN